MSDACRPRAAALYPTRVGRPTLFGSAPCRVALMDHGRNGSADLARAKARARARARAGPHPACVRANVHVGAALSRNP